MFKLSYNLFFNKFYSNLFIALQLAACISFVNFSIAINNSFYYGYNTTYEFNNCYYFSSVASGNNLLIDYDYLEENNYTLEYMPKKMAVDDILISSYGKKTLEYYKDYLKNGSWLDFQNQENTINCLVLGNKKMLGETITKTIKNQTYNFYVCGVVSSNAKSIMFCSPNNELLPGQVFADFDNNYTNIICDYSQTKQFSSKFDSVGMIYYDNMVEEVVRYISGYGIILSMETLRYNADNSIYYTVLTTLSFVGYGIGVLGLISMICMLILNIESNKKTFKIYKHYGMNKNHLKTICIYYSIFLFIFVALLSVVCFSIWQLFSTITLTPVFNFENILFNLFAIIVISVIIFTVFFSRLYGKVQYNE